MIEVTYSKLNDESLFSNDNSENIWKSIENDVTEFVSEIDKIEYEIQLPNFPVRPQFIKINVENENFPNYDDGCGNILGKGVCGQINYLSGKLIVYFYKPFTNQTKISVSSTSDFRTDEQIEKEKIKSNLVPGERIIMT